MKTQKIIFAVCCITIQFVCGYYASAQVNNGVFGHVKNEKSEILRFRNIPFGKPSEEVLGWMLNQNGYAIGDDNTIMLQIDGIPCVIIPLTPFNDESESGFTMYIMCKNDMHSLKKSYDRINELCHRGKVKKLAQTATDTELSTEYDANGYSLSVAARYLPEYEHCVVLNYRDTKNLNADKSRYLCNMLPVNNSLSVDTLSGRMWLTADSLGLRISVSCEAVKTKLGKFYQLYIYMHNNSDEPIIFYPDKIIVKDLQSKVIEKSAILKEYLNRQESLHVAYNAIHDADIRSSVASRGMYQGGENSAFKHKEVAIMNAYHNNIRHNYLDSTEIKSGKAIYGYVYIPYENSATLKISIPVGGNYFDFSWEISK